MELKIELKQFLQKILEEIIKKERNTWNIRRMAVESFVPLTQDFYNWGHTNLERAAVVGNWPGQQKRLIEMSLH